MTKKPKLVYGIKGKLVSAVCMLLVAMIMVVSSTYAWFTLSTAPEVTGIQTAVGANGALEMALNIGRSEGPLTGIVSTASGTDVNTYWGNLVDLSKGYGLDQITLYPSELNITDGKTFGTIMLRTPEYDSTGRVTQVKVNGVTGKLSTNDGNFHEDTTSYGVRAVGVASGMTDRQLAYRNALSAASTAATTARNLASVSLNTNGSALANIAIKYGTSGTTATFGQTDVTNLQKIVTDLLKDNGILDTVEKAYMQYILAYAASSDGGETDTVYTGVKALVEEENATLATVVDGLTTAGVKLPDGINDMITALQTTRQNVTAAQNDLTTLAGYANDSDENNDTIKWADDTTAGTIGIRTPLAKLADPDKMKVNNIEAGKIKDDDNMSTLVNSVASGGLVVTIATGGGVYADIADHCGDYTASVKIEEVTYSGLTLKNVDARMETDSNQTTPYLTAVSKTVSNKPPATPTGDGAATKPMTEFYGYVIDLSFRTNAAESDLLLQTEATDRIYEGNQNDDTMGGGSNMTFLQTAPDFTNDQVKALMACIRVVFFEPGANSNKILAEARLDTTTATLSADGVTADLRIWETITTTTKDESTGAEKTETKSQFAEGNGVITALNQNDTHNVSVLVYLDGTTIDNSKVAATAATSMTGSLNLQFASSATLVPMEYADLHTTTTTTTTGTNETPETPTT